MDLLSVAFAAKPPPSSPSPPRNCSQWGFTCPVLPSFFPSSRRAAAGPREGGREGGKERRKANWKAPRTALTACDCEWATTLYRSSIPAEEGGVVGGVDCDGEEAGTFHPFGRHHYRHALRSADISPSVCLSVGHANGGGNSSSSETMKRPHATGGG